MDARLGRAATAVVALLAIVGCSESSGPTVLSTETGFATGTQALPGSAAGVGGLTVFAEVRATLPADEATVVVPGPYSDVTGSQGAFTTEQRDDIESALGELGIEADRIRYPATVSPFSSGEVEVQVDVDVASIATDGPDIIDAIEDVIDGTEGSGVRFGLTDCTAALSPLQADAIEELDADAADLADAAGVELGSLRSLDEGSWAGSFLVPSSDPTPPCGEQSSLTVVSPDSPAEVELVYRVTGTYEIAGVDDSDGATISAVGSAALTVAADEARVTVSIGDEYSSYGPGQVTLTGEERTAVIDALGELGIDGAAVRFTASDYYNGISASVSVDVEPGRLPDLGEDIADAVGDVVDEEALPSVTFGTSACEDVLTDARTAAIDDAQARLDGLAAASGQSAGDRMAVVETVTGIDSSLDPCDAEASPIDSYGYPSGVDLDAPAEVTIRAAVQVTAAVSSGS